MSLNGFKITVTVLCLQNIKISIQSFFMFKTFDYVGQVYSYAEYYLSHFLLFCFCSVLVLPSCSYCKIWIHASFLTSLCHITVTPPVCWFGYAVFHQEDTLNPLPSH